MRERELHIVVAGAYLVSRVAASAALAPARLPDSASHAGPISLTGEAERPWLVPLVNRLLDDRGVTIVQAAVSAVAFLVLAQVLASSVDDRRVRFGLAGAVLLIGCAGRVSVWDASILSESLAMSSTVLLIAALARLPAWRWWSIGAMVFFVFSKDSHAILAVLVCVGVVVWSTRSRDVMLACGFVVVTTWGVLAAANNREIEGLNVVSHVAARFDDRQIEWFVADGMPRSAALDADGLAERFESLWADPDVREWATASGPGSYVRYALGRPSYLLGGLRCLVQACQPDDLSLLQRRGDLVRSVDLALPDDARWLLAGLVPIGTFEAVRRRHWLLLALVASTLPHALLVYHGSGIELSRHALELVLVVAIAGWWSTALLVDRLLGSRAATAAETPG